MNNVYLDDPLWRVPYGGVVEQHKVERLARYKRLAQHNAGVAGECTVKNTDLVVKHP